MRLGVKSVLYKFISIFIKNVECINCGKKSFTFKSLNSKLSNRSDFIRRAEVIGSDIHNYSCIYCNCNDRLRHLIIYFNHCNYWDKFKSSNILHVAPESFLISKIKNTNPNKYVLGDFYNYGGEIIKTDVTEINEPDDTFDFVICNHVLEHVPDYKIALREFYRILKPEGIAILQTPLSAKLEKTFYDKSITNSEDRIFYYGQADHVHLLSAKDFLNEILTVGFKLEIIQHQELEKIFPFKRYGVNPNEFLIQAIK